MPTYGVTPEGFVLKRLADIRQDMVDALSTVVDPVSGETLIVDLSDENDPLVQIVNSLSDEVAVCWEQLQLAYNQFDPLKATNAGLSSVVQLNSIIRRAGTPSTVELHLTGTPGKVIGAGAQVSNMTDAVLWDLPEFTFDSSGNAAVTAIAAIDGPTQALAGTLVKIIKPVTGWDAVTNPLDAIPGTDEETDTELRLRQQLNTSGACSRQLESIIGGVANITDVTYASGKENKTLYVDGFGLQPKSIAIVAVGGDDTAIANDMFLRVPVGIEYYGNTIISVLDSQGASYPVTFVRPTPVPITIEVDITITDADVYPANGASLIAEAIVAFADYRLSPLTGFIPNSDIIRTRIYTPINTVRGHQINALRISRDGGVAIEQNLVIDWNELASFDTSRITVTEM